MPSNITNSTLAAQIQSLIQSWQTREKQLQTWLGGTVGGGDSSDGTYPLSDYLGNTQYVECPAQLADDVTNTVDSATTQATAAAASATAAAASATSASTAATLAGTYATNAATSATQASNYSNAAGTFQAAALASENAADASATDADTSATAAATSASDASSSATAAASSASDAATSATASASSASDAAASATAAAASAPLPSITGESGKYLTTDGSTVSWATLTIPSAAGSNTQIQFNSSGDFAGSANLTWDGSTLQATNGNTAYPVTEPALVLKNTSAFAQIALDFYYDTSTLNGRIRNDYVGNMTYVAYQSGYHSFLCGGDSGVGTGRMQLANGALTVFPNTTGAASGIYCDGGDITAARASNSGVIYLGSDGDCVLVRVDGAFEYGSVYCAGTNSAFAGYVINDGSKYATFMSNGTDFGVFSQGSGYWAWYDDGSNFHMGKNPYLDTTLPALSSAATVGTSLSDSGALGYIASARRFKKDIRAMTLPEAERLLEAQPIRYRGDPTTCIVHNESHSHYGLIADDLAEIDPRYVHYSGTSNEILTIDYSRIVVPLLLLVKDLRARVLHLENPS